MPSRGHYLTREAEPLSLNVEAVRTSLGDSPFSRLSYTEQTGSTNDDAAAILGDEAAGRVLVTGYQSAGRGRRARSWVAPPGSGLLFTAILPRRVASATLWAVPFWAALGVADGIETSTGLRAGLQWPNDLLLDGAKCAGILCLSRVTGAAAWAACGVGLNVTRPAGAGALAGITPPPAFVSDLRPGITREALLGAILSAFEAQLDLLDDPAACARRWEKRASLNGTCYTLQVDGGPIRRGRAIELASDGSLVAEVDGAIRKFTLADARVLRDAPD